MAAPPQPVPQEPPRNLPRTQAHMQPWLGKYLGRTEAIGQQTKWPKQESCSVMVWEQQYLAHGHSMAKSFSPLNVLKLLTLTPLTPLNLITIKKRQRLLTMPPYILTRRAVKPTKWTKHTRANNTPTGEPSLLSPTGIKIRGRNGMWLSYPEPTPITAMATPTRGITRCEKAEVKTGN